jgi:hypothetical protein
MLRSFPRAPLQQQRFYKVVYNLGSTPILRTLQRSLIMGKRSVYVEEKKVQPRVQAGRG